MYANDQCLTTVSKEAFKNKGIFEFGIMEQNATNNELTLCRRQKSSRFDVSIKYFLVEVFLRSWKLF